jgi:hypothetical protein
LSLARRSIRFRRIAFDEGEVFLFAHGKVSFDGLNLRNCGEHDLRAYKIPTWPAAIPATPSTSERTLVNSRFSSACSSEALSAWTSL